TASSRKIQLNLPAGRRPLDRPGQARHRFAARRGDMVRPHRLAVALVLALAWAGTTRAQAANILELNFWLSGPRYDAVLPGCEDPIVLRKIIQYFGEKERAYWQSDLQIVAFERIRETGFRPWARGAPDAIPRRFCS